MHSKNPLLSTYIIRINVHYGTKYHSVATGFLGYVALVRAVYVEHIKENPADAAADDEA